jgi:hypothetical protein
MQASFIGYEVCFSAPPHALTRLLFVQIQASRLKIKKLLQAKLNDF